MVNKLHSVTLTDFRPRRLHGIQAVAIDDTDVCHPDCHAGGLC